MTGAARLFLVLVFLAVPAGLAAVRAGEAQAPAATAAAAGDAATALETFEAAWKLVRRNHVAQTAVAIDWDALYAELRPRAAEAGSPDETRRVIEDLIARVGQSHFAVLAAPAASDLAPAAFTADAGSLGFDVGLVEGALTVVRVDPQGPAAAAGIRPGWVLQKIGQRSVPEILEAIPATLDPHIRAFRAWMLGTAALRGRRGESTRLTFVDGSHKVRLLPLTREAQRGEVVRLGHLPPQFARLEAETLDAHGARIGLIRFNVWMTPVSPLFDAAVDRFRDADGIVIDLRGNPGGVMMIMGLSGHFLEGPHALGTIETGESELKLVANPRLVNAEGAPVKPFDGPVAILVDSSSYSASEIFAGGMQAIGRARVFGSRTAGGALPAVLERLPGGDVLQYPIGDFVTASGRRIEGQGVVPDEATPLTRRDLLAGYDRALAAALKWISESRADARKRG